MEYSVHVEDRSSLSFIIAYNNRLRYALALSHICTCHMSTHTHTYTYRQKTAESFSRNLKFQYNLTSKLRELSVLQVSRIICISALIFKFRENLIVLSQSAS